MIPSYTGGKFPLSTHLAERVRAMLADPSGWSRAAAAGRRMARHLQRDASVMPATGRGADRDLSARGNRHYLVAYPFEGRLAHQTLGMLLTRRLDRAGARPLGFVANDYGIAIWGAATYRRIDLAAAALDLAHLFRRGHARR